MTAKRFTIVDEQFISYYGGTGHLISNGECEIWLWHSKEASQKVCNKLNSILDENEQLEQDIKDLESQVGNDYNEANSMTVRIAELTEENEQLKKQIDNMAFILRQNGLGLMEDDD